MGVAFVILSRGCANVGVSRGSRRKLLMFIAPYFFGLHRVTPEMPTKPIRRPHVRDPGLRLMIRGALWNSSLAYLIVGNSLTARRTLKSAQSAWKTGWLFPLQRSCLHLAYMCFMRH